MASIWYITSLAVTKARQSKCRYKVSAVGIDRLGNVVGYVMNQQRMNWQGGGLHAEVHLIRKYGKKIKSIFICRVNKKGDLLSIKPCKACEHLMNKLNIRWYSVGGN